MIRTATRNLFMVLGAYWISWWVSVPLATLFSYATSRIHYYGNFEGHVIMPLVFSFPVAIVALGVGAVTAWMIETRRPWRWALIAPLLFFAHGLTGYHWVEPPTGLDKLGQIMGALLPAIACLVGSFLAERQMRRHTN